MVSSIKTYRNGDIGIILNQKCPTCKKKHWVFAGCGENDVIMECLECGNPTMFKIKVRDLSFAKKADEIIKQISTFGVSGKGG